MLLLGISQTDSKIHVQESKKINKINSNKKKEKELPAIIMIDQAIRLITAPISKV
jgi:hypothetical protein